MKSESKPSPNRLPAALRAWHKRTGSFFAILLMLTAMTGFLLNHEEILEPKQDKKHDDIDKQLAVLSTSSPLSSIPVSFEQAQALAKERWGNQRIKKFELKDDNGRLIYRIKAKKAGTLTIDAITGMVTEQQGYPLDRLVKDIHTGKIVGDVGTLVLDVISISLILLAMSGFYLWSVYSIRKRNALKNKLIPSVKRVD